MNKQKIYSFLLALLLLLTGQILTAGKTSAQDVLITQDRYMILYLMDETLKFDTGGYFTARFKVVMEDKVKKDKYHFMYDYEKQNWAFYSGELDWSYENGPACWTAVDNGKIVSRRDSPYVELTDEHYHIRLMIQKCLQQDDPYHFGGYYCENDDGSLTVKYVGDNKYLIDFFQYRLYSFENAPGHIQDGKLYFSTQNDEGFIEITSENTVNIIFEKSANPYVKKSYTFNKLTI